MHIFFNSSEESPGIKGLNVLPYKIKKFNINDANSIPLIGWNTVYANNKKISPK